MPSKMKKQSPNGTRRPVFSIASRFARDAIEVKIEDPVDDTDTGIRIAIRSVYSKEARDAGRAARAQIVMDAKGNIVSSPAENLDSIVAQTIGATAYWFHADLSKPQRPDGTWEREEGFEDVLLLDAGETIPCTPENVRKLYTEPRTVWIQRQVQAAYLDLAGFFDPPKTA